MGGCTVRGGDTGRRRGPDKIEGGVPSWRGLYFGDERMGRSSTFAEKIDTHYGTMLGHGLDFRDIYI